MMKMGILTNPITTLKLKPGNRPDLPRFELQKDKPLGPYNFPMGKFAEFTIHGYKTDAAGIKHPISYKERLPMGRKIRLREHPGITITHCERAIGL